MVEINDLTDDDLLHLPMLLGITDAIWFPLRFWDDATPTNTYFARKEFPDQGFSWNGAGKSAAYRKRLQCWLEDAEARGLIFRFGGTVYQSRLRLTDEGELLARRIAQRPGLEAAWLLVGELARYEPGDGVPEFPHLGTADERNAVENMAVAGLLRGWITSNSSTNGYVRYQIGTLPDPFPRPANDADPADERPGCVERWKLALDATVAELRVAHPDRSRELGYIPDSFCFPMPKLKPVATPKPTPKRKARS